VLKFITKAVTFIFINYVSLWSRGILEKQFTGQNSPCVMEPAVSLPCLHNPAACPYAELHESGSRNSILFLTDHCTSILLSTPRSVNRTRFLSLNQNSVVVSLLPHTCHVSCSFFRHAVRNDRWFYFPLSRGSKVPKYTEGKCRVRAILCSKGNAKA